MNLLYEAATPPSDTDVLVEDRRWNGRNTILKSVRIQSLDPSLGEEVGTVINLSRDGLYFTTSSDAYRIGMELHLIFPDVKAEYQGKVVRIEHIPGGRVGVGVLISDGK